MSDKTISVQTSVRHNHICLSTQAKLKSDTVLLVKTKLMSDKTLQIQSQLMSDTTLSVQIWLVSGSNNVKSVHITCSGKGCSVVTQEGIFKNRYLKLVQNSKYINNLASSKKSHLYKSYTCKNVCLTYVYLLQNVYKKFKVPYNLLPVDFVLSYARRGELLDYIHRLSSFDEPCTKWYTAEIVAALEYLHSKGIIHRLVQMSHHSKPLFLYQCFMQ